MPNKKPKQVMTAEPERWTWQQAEEALSKNVINRNPRKSAVAAFVRLMAEKKWGTTTGVRSVHACVAPIIFDWDGNLIDGQHRLYAQVQSKTAQYWYVLRNADPRAQLVIDGGTARSASDALKFAGYANYTQLSSIARWAWLLEQGLTNSGKIKVANDEVVDMVDRHPDLEHSAAIASYANGTNGIYRPLLKTTWVGAAHWWIAQYNSHMEADLFIERFVHPNKEVDGSALLALMNRFGSAEQNDEHIPHHIQIAMVVRCWNLDVLGKYVQKMPAKTRNGEFRLDPVSVRNVSQEIRFGPFSEAEIESGEYDDVIHQEAS